MPRTDAASRRLRDAQRARLLEAARAVFARRGLAATMEDVAAAARVSHGLAYRYFAGKQELFRALVQDALDRSPPPGLLAAATPGERLRQLLVTLLEARREQPELFLLVNHVLNDDAVPDDLVRSALERSLEFRETLRQLILDGQASGEVIADPAEQLVAAVMACLDGLGRMAIVPGTEFPDARIVLRLLLKAEADSRC